jgi:hypothetical protein
VNFHSELGNRPIRLSFVVQNLGGQLQHQGEALRFRDVNFSDENPTVPDQRLDPPSAELTTASFPLPTQFRVGLNYDLISSEQNTLALMGEFVESNQQKAVFGIAGEYRFTPTETPVGVALRASYQTQPDNEYIGGTYPTDLGVDGLAFGGGLFYRFAERYRVQFDYAYKNYGVLGSVDAFTVTLGFD